MKPTPQQEACVGYFQTGKALRVVAYAGTGKTSTLKLMANTDTRRGLYVAFNKSIADEARKKFPKNVECKTTHSLAFGAIGPKGRGYAVEKLTGGMNGGFLAEQMSFRPVDVLSDLALTPRGYGFWVLETLKRWMSSGRPMVAHTDCVFDGKLAMAPDLIQLELKKRIAKDAARVWERMIDKSSPVPLTHDGYLKLWALSNPQLDRDYILLDEAQDTNGVVLEAMRGQQAQLITVGDPHQQIYEWRGALNAMKLLPTVHEARLSTSFRFGPNVAQYATGILELLRETVPLTGNPDKADAIGPIDNPRTIISRNNATLVENLLAQLALGKSVHVVGGVTEIMTLINATERLCAGQKVDNPLMFYGYKDWAEVEMTSRMPDCPQELSKWVRTVENHGLASLKDAFSRVEKSELDASVILSTAHKSKGREWPDVRLCDDLLMGVKEPKEDGKDRDDDEPARPKNHDAELRLFYVAATRAEEKLDLPAELARKLDIVREEQQAMREAAE